MRWKFSSIYSMSFSRAALGEPYFVRKMLKSKLSRSRLIRCWLVSSLNRRSMKLIACWNEVALRCTSRMKNVLAASLSMTARWRSLSVSLNSSDSVTIMYSSRYLGHDSDAAPPYLCLTSLYLLIKVDTDEAVGWKFGGIIICCG